MQYKHGNKNTAGDLADALQIGFYIICVVGVDDDLQVRMQVPLSMRKANLVLPTINRMHER